MKLGPVTKLDQRKTSTLKEFDGDVMLANCGVVIIFPNYGQFGEIWKPLSDRMYCKTYIFINSNLLSYKN